MTFCIPAVIHSVGTYCYFDRLKGPLCKVLISTTHCNAFQFKEYVKNTDHNEHFVKITLTFQ